MMMLHTAMMAALLADPSPASPIVVQLVQKPQSESVFKWWFPTLIQTILSLGSISAGVAIAVWSFRKNSTKEHLHWTRDQKKAEWKDLLSQIAAIEEQLPMIVTGVRQYSGLEAAVLKIVPALDNTLFIRRSLEESGFVDRWLSFVAYVSNVFVSAVQTDNEITRQAFAGEVDWEAQERFSRDRMQEEGRIRQKLVEIMADLRATARKDLDA